ncbi:hypothetical protein [Allobranchiibius sp. CTAmp26]|uniref:hypothetical protein n=1 Tax=Allobranchiibius sp. CTAmp26 TaxID=2815214 RepID=UPI001AA12970|nr:hypothetical protein [Allobranchiibius sp. CTAmp26]MBO1755917.1 hypothetical protein [Allobranchiibius sp. CTAmp26]
MSDNLAQQDDAGRLFVITGAPACGKSTVGRALADALTKSIFVDGAVMADMVAAGRMPMTAEPTIGALEQLFTRYAGALTLADVYRANGFDTVVADDMVGDYLDDFLDLADTGPLHLIVLHPSVDALHERELARGTTAYGDGSAAENVWNEVEFNTKRVGLWIDNSTLTPTQVVVRILRNLDEATVNPPA